MLAEGGVLKFTFVSSSQYIGIKVASPLFFEMDNLICEFLLDSLIKMAWAAKRSVSLFSNEAVWAAKLSVSLFSKATNSLFSNAANQVGAAGTPSLKVDILYN